MKKSVILIIGIIYVASIVFIGFFGMKITAYNVTVYATKVECINEEATIQNDYKYIIAYYDETKPPEENVYQILWKVYPDDCTNKKVDFVYDQDSKIASVDEFGRVWIKKSGIFYVTIQNTIKSTVTEKIMFYFKKI